MSVSEEMRSFLQRIAVGPAGSKDLTKEEAYRAMGLCLDREASDIQIAVFLIAERLKRESDAEKAGFLEAIVDRAHIAVAHCDDIINLGDPYDGFKRIPHFGPLIAAVTGACGRPTVVGGCSDMPPKHGLTHRRVLECYAGHALDTGHGEESVKRAASRVAKSGCTYVDLADFHPSLWALNTIRSEIAKRPALSTLEKLIMPIRGRKNTHIVSGWVHTGFETQLTEILRQCDVKSVLLFRGREGHIDAFSHRATSLYGYRNSGLNVNQELVPASLGIDASPAPDWNDVTPESVCELWEQILDGVEGPGRTCTALSAAAILVHSGCFQSMETAYSRSLEALSSGAAKASFKVMLEPSI